MVVASTAFVQAADATAKSLGYEPIILWVQHPIQDRTDEELRALADQTFDKLVAGMTASA